MKLVIFSLALVLSAFASHQSVADAIVVGDIVSGARSAEAIQFQLRVQKVLKGEVAEGTLLHLEWKGRGRQEAVVSGIREMWMLKSRGDGWSILPLTTGNSSDFSRSFYLLPPNPALSPIAASLQPNLASGDKVALELAAAIELSPPGKTRLDEILGLL